MTQTERNHAIYDRAQLEVGTYGGQCKPWATHIVYSASGGVVTLPATTNGGDGYQWVYSSDVGQIYESLESTNIHIGMIVQMRIRYANGTYGPHTAIIVQKDASGVTWIESNYSGNGMVTNTRRQTYAGFYGSLESSSSYSVYYIK